MAKSEKVMRETPMMANIGRKVHQAAVGICFTACHVVQFGSVAPQFALISTINLGRASVNKPMAIPITHSVPAPARRQCRGILSHAVAVQRANALHMLIE